MKVVCINNESHPQLEVGKVYTSELIFYISDEPIEWKNNYLNLEGFSDIDWFHTDNFVTIEEWREMQIDKLI